MFLVPWGGMGAVSVFHPIKTPLVLQPEGNLDRPGQAKASEAGLTLF